MRNQPETKHAYSIPRLNWWFLFGSALFLVAAAAMVWVDYSDGEISWLGLRADRRWKFYQREFYNFEKKRLTADAKAAQLRNEEGFTKLTADLAKVKADLVKQQDNEAKLRAELDGLNTKASLVTREFTIEKATRDEVRSAYEAALERNEMNNDVDEVKKALRRVKAQNEIVDDLDRDKQKADAAVAVVEANLNAIVGQKQALEKSLQRMAGSVSLITKRLKELESPLVQGVVNAPVIEFALPTYKVEQIVAEKHHTDVNFTTVPRVDRCIMCHKGIDKKDLPPEEISWRTKKKVDFIEWSKLPQPYTSHPNQDLFVADNSPHPASTYGCTVCHWGWDRETDFSRAGHTPNAEETNSYVEVAGKWAKLAEDEDPPKGVKPVAMTERMAWQKNYHWFEEEFNVQPMRASQYVQASCLKCHTEQTNLKGGDKLDHGRRLVEQLGCWSCHKMKALESYSIHKVKEGEDFAGICNSYDVDPAEVLKLNPSVQIKVGAEMQIPIRTLRKVGPNLQKVAIKDTKEWTRKWLENPTAFRPNTYMPRFWGLDNNIGTPDRNNAEINAITEFLFNVSETPVLPAPPVAGNAEHGKTLVDNVGCLACHVVGDNLLSLKPPAKLAKFMDEWQYRRFRSQGPQLAGTGSKTDKNWLYAWLKDPKQYHPRTKMPNLRLSDQEAADIAEYLTGLRNEATDKQALAPVKEQVLNDLTVEYLEITLPHVEAVEKVNKLDDLIEKYFVDESLTEYYEDPGLLARKLAQQAKLQKKADEEFDDAAGVEAAKLADKLTKVQAAMKAAKDKVAALAQEQKQNVFLGSKLISRYGCFACHDIRGYANAKPIGAELSEWGSKPVSKLDFGLVEIEHNRESWILQKLRAPRSYDLGRIGVTRKPQELLKMPKFNLTDEQREQVITVVIGMTDEKLTPNEPQHLKPAEFQIERGRWLVKENNCQGCHLVEGRGWAIRGTGIPAGMEPPMISGTPTQLRQGQRTQPDWLFHFLKAPPTGQVRPWLKARMPTFGFSDAEANVLVRYFALEGNTQFPYQTPTHRATAEELAVGKKLFEGLSCVKCHIVDGKALGKPLAEIPEEDLGQLAPNLSLAHSRLQRDWLVNKWLVDPLSQQPGTRMPQFDYGTALPAKILPPEVMGGDARKRIEALADYVLSLGAPVNIETPVASEKKQP
ncbi:MAG: c-type cytochrome [Verrucomicrobiota bacterium]